MPCTALHALTRPPPPPPPPPPLLGPREVDVFQRGGPEREPLDAGRAARQLDDRLPVSGDPHAKPSPGTKHHTGRPEAPQRARESLGPRPVELRHLLTQLGRERRRRIVGHHAALGQQHDAVRGLGLGEIVGGEEDRGSVGPPLYIQQRPDRIAVLGVEPHRRLVEDEQLRLMERYAGDVEQQAPPQPYSSRAGRRARSVSPIAR